MIDLKPERAALERYHGAGYWQSRTLLQLITDSVLRWPDKMAVQDASGHSITYRELDVQGRQFIFPTTTPSQFEPQAMHASIDRLLALSPPALYLTHYGQLYDVAQRGQDLHRRLDALVALAQAERHAGPARHQRVKAARTQYLLSEIRAHGCTLPEQTILDLLETDLELNTQGLTLWLDSQAA